MSRYESSRFVKNPQIMNQEVLKYACEKLGWKYTVKGNDLYITGIPNVKLYGEFAMKVSDDQVTYNSYYLRNGRELVTELQNAFFPLNVEYAKKTIISSFQAKGFTLRKLYDFRPTEEVAEKFNMVGYTKIPNEKEKRYEIQFSVLSDGTVVTDSNYLPDDVNERAHSAMDDVEIKFGNKRIMTKKPEYDKFIREHRQKATGTSVQTIK